MEIERKYGVATTIYFPLIDAGAQDFESTPVTFASGDTQVMKDGAAFANTTNNPTHEGNGIYSLSLTATEMQAALIVVTLIDSATKTWEDQAILIATYGNASAQHAFDLDTASTAQTGDNYARLGAPAGASIAADIATVEGQTDDIGVAGAGLTAIPWNAAWDAEVESEVDDALGAGGADLTAVPWNAAWDVEVQSEVQDALEANHLDHLLAADYDPASKPGVATALLNELVEDDGGVSRFTANALEQGPGGNDPAATEIADAVLNRDLSAVGLTPGRRSLGQAMRKLVNKVSVSLLGVLSVYEEDDLTVAWTADVTTNPSANNITEIDPT